MRFQARLTAPVMRIPTIKKNMVRRNATLRLCFFRLISTCFFLRLISVRLDFLFCWSILSRLRSVISPSAAKQTPVSHLVTTHYTSIFLKKLIYRLVFHFCLHLFHLFLTFLHLLISLCLDFLLSHTYLATDPFPCQDPPGSFMRRFMV